ncbi:MAG: hypothetical protein IPI57_12230 [Candidatus Competibacteraceae bacterium]|nr:hypothetical protein [Candidatus Competibacteraceae bacterium]
MWVTVWTGSNGSGTIIGQATARQQVTAPQAVGASSYPSYLCAGRACRVSVESRGSKRSGGNRAFRRHQDSRRGRRRDCGRLHVLLRQLHIIVNTDAVRQNGGNGSRLRRVGRLLDCSGDAGQRERRDRFWWSTPISAYRRGWINPMLATVNVTTTPPNATFSAAMSGGAAKTMLSVGGLFRPLVTFVGPATSSAYGFAMAWE